MGGQVDLSVRTLQAAILATAVVLGALAGFDPKLALAAALGLAFVAVVLGDLSAGIVLFTVISFVDLLPLGGPAVTLAKLAGVLLALSWLATLSARGDDGTNFLTAHPVVAYLLLAFLGWAALSLTWAEDPVVGAEAVYRYALNIALFVIVFTAVTERKHVSLVLTAFVAGATVSALYGFLNPVPAEYVNDVSRLGGAGVDPNEMAAVAVAALVLAAALAAGWHHQPAGRVLALCAVGFCAATVVLSFSRAGLVALAIALIVAVVVGGRWRSAAALFLLVVAVGIGGYHAFYASPQERDRITKADGGTGREDVWEVGWRMVEDSPTNGIGVGNFQVSSIHYLLEPGTLQRSDFIVDEPKVAHNIYLHVLAELGIVGLTMFLAIVAFSLACALRAARAFRDLGDTRMELIGRGLFVATLAMLAADFFLSEQFSKQLWLLLALGPCLLAIARRTGDEQPDAAEAPA
jgi:O-antigen ligase